MNSQVDPVNSCLFTLSHPLGKRWQFADDDDVVNDGVQGHSGGDLASSLRYLKILSLRSTFPPLR